MFNRTWRTMLRIGRHDCRDYVKGTYKGFMQFNLPAQMACLALQLLETPVNGHCKALYNEASNTAAQANVPVDPNAAFYEVGGRKKGEVPGLDTGNNIFYSPGPTRGKSTPYTLCFVLQLQGQVQQMKDYCEERVATLTQTYEMRLTVQEENQLRIEENMMMVMDFAKERCGYILPFDLFRPRGSDPNGASGSAPTT